MKDKVNSKCREVMSLPISNTIKEHYRMNDASFSDSECATIIWNSSLPLSERQAIRTAKGVHMNDQLIPFYWKPVPIDAELPNAAKRTIASIRRYWKFAAVLSDAVYLRSSFGFLGNELPDTVNGQALPRTELRGNELSAVVFRVGNYSVRSSLSVYLKDPLRHIGPLHMRIYSAADSSNMDYIRQELLTTNLALADSNDFSMKDLYIFHEVSAKPISQLRYKPVFRARCGAKESIETICAAKANRFISDKKASLFIRYKQYDKKKWILFDGSRIYDAPCKDVFED